jgi:DNA polymerase-3 subunit alpha
MITGKTVKTTRNNKLMAFLTLEDLVGSVEVIVFPKDYESKRELFVEDAKVFIQGRASIGDDPVGKVICERVIPFQSLPKELWLKFPDKDVYMAREAEILSELKESEGNDTVIIYLEKERAKKVLPANRNVSASNELVSVLTEKLGEKNVKVVEKTVEKIRKMN